LTDQTEKPTSPGLSPVPDESSSLRSPIRPVHPEVEDPTRPAAPPARSGLIAKAAQISTDKAMAQADSATPDKMPENPQAALELLRRKMEIVANEFGEGKINRAQFNAMYGRYGEQRTIIETLLKRNPENPAWKQAAAPGHTSFLRQHFEARLVYFLVYQHNIPTPLMMGGKQQPNMDQVSGVLQALWKMNKRPKIGLARKEMGSGQWMVLALGEYAVTLAMFMLEPSVAQATLVRDLHNDFERANRRSLSNGTRSLDRFVFPQRALAEKDLGS